MQKLNYALNSNLKKLLLIKIFLLIPQIHQAIFQFIRQNILLPAIEGTQYIYILFSLSTTSVPRGLVKLAGWEESQAVASPLGLELEEVLAAGRYRKLRPWSMSLMWLTGCRAGWEQPWPPAWWRSCRWRQCYPARKGPPGLSRAGHPPREVLLHQGRAGCPKKMDSSPRRGLEFKSI